MKKSRWIGGWILLAFALGGCAVPRLDKTTVESSVPVNIIPTQVATVSEARAVQTGADLFVSGTIKKYHEFLLPGHVDVVICDLQGTVVAMETPRLTGYASKKGGVKEARFSALVRLTPPPGATARVKYHAPSSGEDHLNCT
jgi:hypothetical protein